MITIINEKMLIARSYRSKQKGICKDKTPQQNRIRPILQSQVKIIMVCIYVILKRDTLQQCLALSICLINNYILNETNFLFLLRIINYILFLKHYKLKTDLMTL